jgi:hypothetical protein
VVYFRWHLLSSLQEQWYKPHPSTHPYMPAPPAKTPMNSRCAVPFPSHSLLLPLGAHIRDDSSTPESAWLL